MTAADSNARELRRAALRANVERWAAPIGCALVLALLAYARGAKDGSAHERTRVADSVRVVLADSSRVIEKREHERAKVIVATAARVDTLRIPYERSRARVTVVSDTLIRVDSILVNVPVPVVQRIASCDSLVVADSIAYRAVVAQLTDVTHDRDVWKERAELDERQLKETRIRLGFKSGLAAGVALAAVVVRLVR